MKARPISFYYSRGKTRCLAAVSGVFVPALLVCSVSALMSEEGRGVALRHPENPTAIYADAAGKDVALVATLPDGGSHPIQRHEVEKFWAQKDGLVLLADDVDACSLKYAWNRRFNEALRPVGWDLSDAAGWPDVDVPPGALAVDPLLGRFKFYQGKAGPFRDGHGIRLPHGNSFGFVIKGKYLYQAGGESLRDAYVVDISDPANPKWVSQVYSKGFCAYAVGIVGEHLVVSCRERMQVVDVSDPLRPKNVANYSDRIAPMKIQTEGNLVFVIGRGQQKMNIVDLSQATNPKTLYQYYPGAKGGRIYDVIPNKDHVYLWGSHPGKGSGMLVMNISNPAKPVEVAYHPGIDVPSAYVNKNWIRRNGRLIGFQPSGKTVRVLDITDPKEFKTIWEENINAKSRNKYDSVGSVAVKGNIIYVASGAIDYEEGSLKIYEADDDLKNWKLLGAYKGRAERCRGPAPGGPGFSTLTPVGNYLLASRASYGLIVFDVSDSANPKLVNGLPLAGECFGVAVDGPRAYAALNFGGLGVIDNTNPLKARMTTTVRSAFKPLSWEVAAQGNFVYSARRFIADVTDVNNPKTVAEISANYDNGIAVDGSRLFYGNGGTLTMADVTDPANPKIRSNTNVGNFFGLAVRGNHLFVGHRKTGLQVYDVSDMARPKLVAENKSQGGVKRIALAGNVLLAGKVTGRNQSNVILIFDVTDPLRPQFVSKINGECNYGLAAKGDYFYAASYYAGSQWLFFDMTDIKKPKQIWQFRSYHPTGITVHGRYVYASSLSSITVFDAPVSGEGPRGGVALEFAGRRSAGKKTGRAR